MSFEYINKTYKVNACLRRKVLYEGRPGVITGHQGQYVLVVLDEDRKKQELVCHPTWEMVYLDEMGWLPKLSKSQERYRRYIKEGWGELGHSFREFIKNEKKLRAYYESL